MGIFSFFRRFTKSGRAELRKERELAALKHLRDTLAAEIQDIRRIANITSQIQDALIAQNFQSAEVFLQSLVKAIREKKLHDRLEFLNERILNKTMFKDIKERTRVAF